MNKVYAGIGSRETPSDILELMTKIASVMEEKEWFLRSGGAKGADQAFEEGIKFNKKAIFTPRDIKIVRTKWELALDEEDWNTYNEYSKLYNDLIITIQQYHPNPPAVLGKPYTTQLMARNAMIVLGYWLNEPVDFVVCWTKDGKASGGTGQAIRIAEDKGIPVWNLQREDHRKLFEYLVEHKPDIPFEVSK